ncbi:MAG: low molecular weight phosphotyrosine protein phosphatase [Bacteroidales bacterium]|jgi:protein-tyrosine phosphatase|nr:low molecular weight phosphotyrosine protein phosphatase [Bacteroidales bacterium]
MNKIKILFVCSGNICRSPAAEAVYKKMVEFKGLENYFEIDSAGTGGWHVGEMADGRMQIHAKKRGYNLDSISRKINPYADFDNFDLIIGMDNYNIRELKSIARKDSYLAKIYKMTDFATECNYSEVPDPYYDGGEGFELVLDLLENSCKGLLENIVKTRFHTTK